jgi:DNA mismatch repair ATPase MutS
VKAFLMHRDRDFDPQRILARREKDNRRRRRDEGPSLAPLLPWNEKAIRQDLGLDILLQAMSEDDDFLLEVAKVALLSGTRDLGTIHYRQRILRDCTEREAVIRRIYKIAVDAIEGERKNYFWSGLGRYPSGTLHHAVEVLEMFVGQLKALRNIADEYAQKFESEGFRRLFDMLQRELSNNYFAEIERHLANLRLRHGVLISAGLGKGNKGVGYVLRRPNQDTRMWIERMLSSKSESYTFRLHPRDEAGARALSELRDRGVNLVANALAQSTDHILSFFEMLRTELAFYIGALNLERRLGELQEPVCLPSPAPQGAKLLSASGLYDPSLALTADRTVVANDLSANGKDLIVITGANTGGKSTFMRSIGLAQLMMQAGMFVAARSFSAEIRDGLITHFKREEDAAMESGKLDEELSRMSSIIDKLARGAMVLFNESFAATNEREGSEIAMQITTALLEKGIKVFFVTHLYEFARKLRASDMQDAIFLRAERRDDGRRTFRIIEGEPLQTSYGRDLYNGVFGQDKILESAG